MPDPVTFKRMTTSGNGEGRAGASAIVVRSLAKRFGEVEAVRGVDFEVAAGEVFGFLGPNGAGKTTTINMLCTLAKPTSGSATVAGHDVVRERDDVRRNIGLVFQDPTLDGYLTAAQNLRLHAELYGVQSDLVAPRMQQVLQMVGLWDRKDAHGEDLLRRHAPPPRDRPRADALPARAVPRRADDRPRSSDAPLDLDATSASSRSARRSRSS